MSFVRSAPILFLFLWITVLSVNKAENKPANEQNLGYSDSAQTGKQLAIQYCQRCHLFPEPALLDKKTWIKSVLPNMGQRLGIRIPGNDPFTDLLPEEEKLIRQLDIFPASAQLSNDEWVKNCKLL